ncbi:MAG: M23 family peptidase, partial [Fulvivirga sp.]
MAKIRYYYDTETCKYEPIKVSRSAMVLNVAGFLTVSLIMALGLIYVYRANFTPVKESNLRSENSKLKLEWNILNNNLNNAYASIDELQFKDDNIYRVILDTDAIPATIREGGVGGHNKYERLLDQELPCRYY